MQQHQVEYEVWDARNDHILKGYGEEDAKKLANSLNRCVVRNMGLPVRVNSVVGPFYVRRVR